MHFLSKELDVHTNFDPQQYFFAIYNHDLVKKQAVESLIKSYTIKYKHVQGMSEAMGKMGVSGDDGEENDDPNDYDETEEEEDDDNPVPAEIGMSVYTVVNSSSHQ